MKSCRPQRCQQHLKSLRDELRDMGLKLSMMVKKMMDAGQDLKVEEFMRRQRSLVSDLESEMKSCRWAGDLWTDLTARCWWPVINKCIKSVLMLWGRETLHFPTNFSTHPTRPTTEPGLTGGAPSRSLATDCMSARSFRCSCDQ